MRITNHKNLPAGIVAAIVKAFEKDAHESIRRDPRRISITEANLPARIATMRRTHDDKLVVDASELIWALEGQVSHLVMEMAGKMTEDLHELALETEIEGLTLSGRIDVIQKRGVISDLKRCSVWKFADGVPEEFQAQLNGYWMLAMRNREALEARGIDPEKLSLEIVAWYRDWNPIERARRGKDYPEKAIEVFPVDRWPLDRCVRHYASRVREHREARNGPLPRCTDKERMCRDSHWAIVPAEDTTGTAKARRRLETEAEAEQYRKEMVKPDAYKIEYRPGQPHRCLYYCPVKAYCEQWKAEQLKATTAPAL